MAAEAVGGAFLSSLLGVVFERLSSTEVVNWIRGKKLNQELLGKLKTTLYAAEALLNDAERRQIKERAVKEWLDSLKDAVYVADDLLDEVSTKATTQKDEGELIHLRYLDLSNTPIVVLLESLSNLYNLLTVKLNGCYLLKMLPSCMQGLVNLRHLDVSGTCLKEMPKGMNKLKNLQHLSDYIVGKHEENGIRELGALGNLHGSFSIAKLENVNNSDEALKANMIDKKDVNILCLNWSLDDDIVDFQTERDILDKLQPHIDLTELSVEGYRGTTFSNWLGHNSYHNMTQLALCGSSNCSMLPSLGQLPSLKYLSISYFDKLKIIGVEFYKNDKSCQETPFPSLETLLVYRMPCWQVWHSFEFDAFPQLKDLTIWECPLLMGDLPNHLPALEKLNISGCKQLACSLQSTPRILELSILYGDNEVRMQELPLSLCSLSISGSQQVMSMLKAITHTQPTCLQSLFISNCSLALSFPGACMPSSLQVLKIWDCKKLEFPMQQQHESLQSLTIFDSCDSLTSFPLAAFPNITKLVITRCEYMECLKVSQSNNAALPSLRDLSISRCPSFLSLLSQSQDAALPSLRSLRINDCRNFVSLSTLGMVAPQLEYLEILSCPKIDSFAKGDEGLPPKLRELRVIKCSIDGLA